tara:strand:- start:206 stop:442 length:237 start_codon:yes stop_codon:yes gene_type:complete
MIRIALVGEIASGKTFVAKCFKYPMFNADKEVKKIYIYIFFTSLSALNIGYLKHFATNVFPEAISPTKAILIINLKVL